MRVDSTTFSVANWSPSREPRYVVRLIYGVSSPSFTSHAGIASVPGDVIDSVVAKISSISQEVRPEDGRTTIGSLTVELAENGDADVTAKLRQQFLTYDQSPRDRELRVYVGYDDDFNSFALVATMFVDGVKYDRRKYSITARDRTRELRTKIFASKKTVLTAALTDTATTATVADTTEFALVAHNAAFSDAPSATVGYVKVKDTDEVIRYTGKTGTTFTGLTRGCFNTKAQAVPFDSTDSRDNWPEVEEFIYLEMPGPLCAIAIMTGVLNPYGSPPTVALPDHWHLGMSWADAFDHDSWRAIGVDLYDPANLALGFPVRFLDLDEADGKTFVEQELFRLLGLYAATTTAGKLRLRRINRVLPAAGYLATLTTADVVTAGSLDHDFKALLNQIRIDYNWDGEDYTRSVLYVDTESITVHGLGDERQMKFKGLNTARHTAHAIRDRVAVYRDRYGEPPLRIQVTVAGHFNGLEIGDPVRLTLPGVEDYTAASGTLDRVFEVQRVDIDWITGAVKLNLFATSRLRDSAPSNDDTDAVVADAWYTGTGTNITSLTGYSAAHLTANVTLTGSATDIRASGSIWYHAGDLTINSGVTVTIVNNVQLRVRGFLTINGKIDGAGRGYAGATEPDSVGGTSSAWARPGTAGYLGPTKAGDGIRFYNFDARNYDDTTNIDGPVVEGRNGAAVAGPLALDVTSTALTGFPDRLQGSSGSRGGQIVEGGALGAGTIRGRGGAGGASGAGLLIVHRGLGFGVAGQIDLSGNDGSAADNVSSQLYDVLNTSNDVAEDFRTRGGGGAGGYPGTFYCICDGDGIAYPDINTNTFAANRGNTPLTATSAAEIRPSPGANRTPFLRWPSSISGNAVGSSPQTYITGRNANWQGARANIWSVAHYVQYVPAMPDAQLAPATRPSSLTAASRADMVTLSWNWPPAANTDYMELWASTTNDRSVATEVAVIRGSTWNHAITDGLARYYWIRARTTDGRVSGWYPSGANAGVYGSPVVGALGRLGVLMNYDTFSHAANGYCYFHGYTSAGAAADVDGSILHNGAFLTVPKGKVRVSQAISAGWFVLDERGASPSAFPWSGHPGAKIAGAGNFVSGGWQYDAANYGTPGWAGFPSVLLSLLPVIGIYSYAGSAFTAAAVAGSTTARNYLPAV